MARAQLNDQWQEPDEQDGDGDWQALRSDLVNLLNQVEDRVAGETQPAAPNTARSKPTRSTPKRPKAHKAAAQPRREKALQAVSRTMARVSERDQSADTVSSAIDQIRGKHSDIPQRRMGRVNTINDSVSSMAYRLEQLGADLRENDPSPAGLQEISEQVEQLTYAVELLAGAVGETGQVKRLEAQIADIAQMIEDAQQSGAGGLNSRIENLVDEVTRLTDMQQQHADRPIAHLEELAISQTNGLQSIETGVRNVYDRIDSIEQSLAANPNELARLGDEMAAITQEMANVSQLVKANSGPSNTLLGRVDALNARIAQIEDRGDLGQVGGLQADVETLRDAIHQALEPKFEDIKSQINNLERAPVVVASDGEAPAASNGSLEAQIRQILARMDQTGEQLTDIKQLYQQAAKQGGGEMPDIEALADLVASRTSEAVSRNKETPVKAALDTDGLDALEKRMTQLFSNSNPAPEGDNASEFASVQAGIKQVDKRLAGLEEALNRPVVKMAATPAKAPTPPSKPVAEKQPAPAPSRPPRAAFADRPAAPIGGDSMQVNPAEEKPLVDQGFKDEANPAPTPEQPAPEAARPSAPEVKPERQAPPEGPASHAYDPSQAEIPSRPRSSLADDAEPAFEQDAVGDSSDRGSNDRLNSASAGRNTFIEAARRAAQRQEELEPAGSQSLIARAFARFQRDRADTAPVEIAPDMDVEAPQLTRAERKAEAKAAKLAKKAEAAGDGYVPLHVDADDAEPDAPEGSFVSRHLRTILLALAVVIVSLLALNLVQSRLGDGDTGAPAVGNAETIAPNTPARDPITPAEAAPIDSAPTGSIDTMVRMVGDAPSPVSQALPTMLQENLDTLPDQFTTGALPKLVEPAPTLPETLPAAIKLELPPESVGPLALRQAAADGDARAQFEIAAIYSEGKATAQNLTESAKWYERSAAQGFVPAEYRLGNLYEHGKGVTQDLSQAKLWYQRAAEAGNRMSMHNLAALYASGELGTQEFPMAAEWFERAATLGLTDSQFNLGMLYARGLGVTQNLPESYKWFSLAALQGDDGAQKARDDVARSLDADTVSRLQAEIAGWQRAAIDIPANFAPIGTWTDNFNPGQTINDKSIVEKVQAALNRLGYDVGVPDGLMGPRTRDAIMQFEKAAGMSEVGAINPRLLAVLGSQPV